jgi:AraC-like DNA-binding protein
LFFGLYVVVHRFLKFLLPRYYNPEQWTIRRECSVLLCWIPTTAVSTCLFAGISIPEFELSLPAILELEFYNFVLSGVSFPTFGYFVDRKFKTISATESTKLPERETESKPEPKSIPKLKSNLNLTEMQSHNILQTLHNVMETEQFYLSKKCSEQQVATCTNIPLHHISYTINTFTGLTFSNYLNKYRVEHACRMLQNGPNKKLKLEAVGFECGFGSKASFYAAFRKFTGTTPAAYLDMLNSKWGRDS